MAYKLNLQMIKNIISLAENVFKFISVLVDSIERSFPNE